MNLKKKILNYFSLLLVITSCTDVPEIQNKNSNIQQAAFKKTSPEFNSDSAYFFIQKQVDFGSRVTASSANLKCANWIVSQFKKYGAHTIEQKAEVKHFDNPKLPIINIIAEYNPEAKKRILICTHWDSRPYADNDSLETNRNKPILAADDGASGVGIMLEMARILNKKLPNVGVDFICFDAEDLGKSEYENSFCLGSQYWSKNLHKPNYKAEFGILMDMVGGKNAKFVWEETSVDYAEPVLRKVWDLAINLGFSNWFYYYKKGGITDDHLYINELAKIPTIDIIHYSETSGTGFAPWWHTANDNMNNIDRNTLKAVGQTLLEVIYREQ